MKEPFKKSNFEKKNILNETFLSWKKGRHKKPLKIKLSMLKSTKCRSTWFDPFQAIEINILVLKSNFSLFFLFCFCFVCLFLLTLQTIFLIHQHQFVQLMLELLQQLQWIPIVWHLFLKIKGIFWKWFFFKWKKNRQNIWGMAFCYQNCSDLLWEKIVLVIKKKFLNSRLKAENFKIFEITKVATK